MMPEFAASIVARNAGTPQGGVISPLLARLFLHYAFDMWMVREFPHIPFERYADDAICHCRSAEEAQALWSALGDRLAACKLVLHPEKTKIVYCKDVNRRGDFPVISFDFLGLRDFYLLLALEVLQALLLGPHRIAYTRHVGVLWVNLNGCSNEIIWDCPSRVQGHVDREARKIAIHKVIDQ